MRLFKKRKLLGGFAALAVGGLLGMPYPVRAQEANPSSDGAEVLTRGPVHEAFAETISFDPQAGIIVDRAPPELIEEVPPEQQLEGDNVTWIPGYWAWDEDRSDFVWISGIWRNLPPGREWVPGYWADVEGKHQWTSGYWQDAKAAEVAYLPEPPKSLEQGPNVKATSNDQSWVPGNWVYREQHYAWRPGNWAQARENWIWVPAYYRWTPRGYVYVDGYWDYPVARRGVVFAPVHFSRDYISRPNYTYTPTTVIALAVFTNHLFLRPRYNHYYYGDYYEPRYRQEGFYASYSYSSGHHGYDPFYSHQRWEHRDDRNWENSRRDYFEYRRDNEDARPPRDWAALSSRGDSDRQRGDYGVVERYDRVVNNHDDNRQKFKKIDKADRARYITQSQEIRNYGKERTQLEVRPQNATQETQPVSAIPIKRSPVIARNSTRSVKNGGPPARLQQQVTTKDILPDPKAANGKMKNPDRVNTPGKSTQNEVDSTGIKDKTAVTDKTKPVPELRTEPGKRRVAEPGALPKIGNNDPASDKKMKDLTPKERKIQPTEKLPAGPDLQKKETATPDNLPPGPAPEKKAQPGEKRHPLPAQGKNEKSSSPEPPVKKAIEKSRETPAPSRPEERKAPVKAVEKTAPPARPTEKKAPARSDVPPPQPRQQPQPKPQPQQQPQPKPQNQPQPKPQPPAPPRPRPEPKQEQKRADPPPARAQQAPPDSGRAKASDKDSPDQKKKN